MIQLGKFVGGGVGGWLTQTTTTYIQLAGAGSIYLGAINYKYSKMSNKNLKSMLLFQNLNGS